ncbi:cytosolic phospholipase A2 gamma-like [Xyrichtys novacula]|uniref:Cytosolic phospholipase A2 gamma-like n=1 Tax=Xyrichtys novacula TaxID=13765 RepID=A0AAV1GW57_XYRNO|nr:cytosolic phospholipase A2 gamma-like [Xyrichtys novacula]
MTTHPHAQTRNTSYSYGGKALLYMRINTTLTSGSNMEGEKAASEKPVRNTQLMCAGEEEYVDKRKKIVLESLSSLGIKCAENSVPHIAVLGSGGAERAAVSLLGCLHQMEKDGLLNSVLYLGGVSGSTWSMAYLYGDPEWSITMDRAISRLVDSDVDLGDALSWLCKRANDEDFSLSDIWGLITSAVIMNQMDVRRLSGEASRDATNPYPVYCAIEKNFFRDGPTEGKWFEMSPYEAGFTELGLFVETSLLGSKFESGRLVETLPEMDMIKLQGILGSALASEGAISEFISNQVGKVIDAAHEVYVRVYTTIHKLISLIRKVIKQESELPHLDKLLKLIGDSDEKQQHEHARLQSKSSAEKESFYHQECQNLICVVETWRDDLEEGPLKKFFVFIRKVFNLIMDWEWGTTNNFLYKYQHSDMPDELTSMEDINLMDAGLFINIPYPSFLGEKRDIDLIIALEYSAGDMFETLTLARDYAKELKKPFPEIDEKVLEEKEWPKDFYVFEGKEKVPTIVYMPLFNNKNCKDVDEVKAKMTQFSTFRGPLSKEEINDLLETAKENMKRNKENIIEEIKKASQCRHNKQNTTEFLWKESYEKGETCQDKEVLGQNALSSDSNMEGAEAASEDSVPHIALLGSGGGTRAAVSLIGSLYQLEKDGLLNSVLYLGGVSGSTWSMIFLYQDVKWSLNMEENKSKMMDSNIHWTEKMHWLRKRVDDDDFSLTDLWGLLTCSRVMKQLDQRHLSKEAWREATNPYPIYCAIEKHFFRDGPPEGKWFEITPHEAGFTELGLFVKTSHLGSKFESGEVVEKTSEMDMIHLQGILGSALASERKIREFIFDKVVFIKKILFLIMYWEWGTTNNFLYKYQHPNMPDELTSMEDIHLMDAGLMMNLPYPSFWGEKRDIDLIISLEYSAGDMFVTLIKAKEHAEELKKPFPEIDENVLEEEKEWPKDFYVFEGTEKVPTIVYMPLFNRNNCKDVDEFKTKMDKFDTFRRPFSPEEIKDLLGLAEENMKRNKENIMEEIKKAVTRREKKQK